MAFQILELRLFINSVITLKKLLLTDWLLSNVIPLHMEIYAK